MLRLFTALLILTADLAGCAAMPLRLACQFPPDPAAPHSLSRNYPTVEPGEKRMYRVSQ